MGTDNSSGAYATPAESVSDEVEALEAGVSPAMPMDDSATDMWEQQGEPQLIQPTVKIPISTSGGI